MQSYNMHLREESQIRRPIMYHNYNLSKKNLDGDFLMNLFLINDQLFKDYKRRKILDSRMEKPKKTNYIYSKIKCIDIDAQQKAKTKTEELQVKEKQIQNQKTIFHKRQINSSQLRKTYHSEVPVQGKQFIRRSVQVLFNQLSTPKIANQETTKVKIKKSLNLSQRKKAKPQKFQLRNFIQPTYINEKILMEGRIEQSSSQSITIMKNNIKIYQLSGKKQRQIASLTKIMTCICSIYLANKNNIDIEKQKAKISRFSSNLQGTTANLRQSDIVSINDLLYGMMLPSGNDAAEALAEYFGIIEYKKSEQYKEKQEKISFKMGQEQSKRYLYISHNVAVNTFIKQMNNFSEHLKLSNTFFSNSHGLSDNKNLSSSNDIAKLSFEAMKNTKFKQIVNTREYEATIFNKNTKMLRTQKWINTNILLDHKYCEGIKTGITPTAGPCMSAYFNRDGFEAIVVILKAKSKNKRFEQVCELFEWARKNFINTQ